MVKTRRRLTIAGACVGAVLLVGALIGIQQLTGKDAVVAADPSSLVNVDVAKATLAGIPETKGVLGLPTAPATIRVYADLRCPVCKEWDAAEAPDVIAAVVKPGQAKLDLRLWAILGANSEAAHRAGYAAMQQNKLWLYATIVYYNQGDERQAWFDDAFARAVATAAGLDLKRFDADRTSAAADTYIAGIGAEADSLGLTGTPTIGVAKGIGQPTFFSGIPTTQDIVSAVRVAAA
jgi:protein-disulfide isomerase